MSERILIIYDSEHGVLERMATVVASGIKEAGLNAIVEKCEVAKPEDLLAYQGIIIGSPCYFAGPGAAIKAFVDSTYGLKGKLEGKVGGAFTSSAHISGGNELTLRALHDAFLIHGMVIQGDPEADHFGAVVIAQAGGEIVTDTSGECHRLGIRVAELVKKMS